MIQAARFILVVFSFSIPMALAANGESENDLSFYKQNDYYVKKAKLELAKRSHRQLQALSKQTHLLHLKDWRENRQGMVQYLSRKETPTQTDLQNYTNAKYEGL